MYAMKSSSKLIIVHMIILLSIGFFTGCSNKKRNSVVQEFILNLEQQKEGAIINMLLSRDEYFKNIYPYTEAYSEKDTDYDRDVFWRTFIGIRRIASIKSYLFRFKNKKIEIIDIDDPEMIIKTGHYRLHKYISVKLKLIDKKTEKEEIYEDKKMIGIIAENTKTGEYKLFNVFRE